MLLFFDTFGKCFEPPEYKSNLAEIKILISGSFIRKQIFIAGNKIAWVFYQLSIICILMHN